MMKCRACGRRMQLKKEQMYLVPKDNKSLVTVFNEQYQAYEAFDCPRCGCQNLVGVRELRPHERLQENEKRGD